MNRLLIKSFAILALLLSISEVASGGTVRIVKLLNGAVSNEALGETSYSIGQDNSICTVTVTPATAYSVESVTAVKVTNGDNAQARSLAPAINVPIEVTKGDVENTWMFVMPSEEYDVEVMVNFSFRTYALTIKGIEVTGSNKGDVLGNGTVSYDSETNVLTLNNASVIPDTEMAGVEYLGDDDLTIMLIGNDTIQGAGGCIGIQWYSLNANPKIIFTTDEETPGQLISTENERLIDEYANIEYQNGLAFSYIVGGQMIGCFETYDLWVNGIQATAVNKDNVLCDENKTVRFDETTNTLTLRKVDLITDDGVVPVESMLDSLTVNLVETNHIVSSGSGIFVSREMAEMPTLTFTTPDLENPGKLEFEGGELQAGFSEDIVFDNALSFNAEENCVSVVPGGYGLIVAGTEVTNVNYNDVLHDGTVSYAKGTATLTLNDAHLTGDIVLNEYSSISTLTVMLKGESTTTSMFISEKADANLMFDINPNNPGSLTFTGKASVDDIQTGFSFSDENLLNELKQGLVNEGNDWKIATFIPIEPIVDEEDPEVTVDISPSKDYSDLVDKNIDNIYYNLPDTGGDENPLQGYDDEDGTPGIVIGTPMTDTQVETACNSLFGSDEFKNSFTGISVMTPAGIGDFSFYAKALGTGGELKVKIGDEEPYTPNVNTDDYIMITVHYNCSEPTPILIYLQQAAPSRLDSPFRGGKIKSGTVKITNYSGSSKVLYQNNTAIVYSMPSGAYNGSSVNLSVINSNSYASLASRRQGKAFNLNNQLTTTEIDYPIVALGRELFDEITDKEGINYIDLSETQIKDFVVNRQVGVMNGFADHTFILLPSDNDDGMEPNVVIGDNCKEMVLDDAYTFLIPNKEFTADKVTLNRTFDIGQTSTLFLPFTIPATDAAALGQFHSFKEIQGSKAVFNYAEQGDIDANTPFVFVPKATSIEASGVSVKGLNATSATTTDAIFVGTYEPIVWNDDPITIYDFAGAAVTSVDGDIVVGEFVRASAGASIKPFKAYLNTATPNPSRLQVVIDNMTTGIADVESMVTTNKWHTLNGQTLEKKPSQKGFYIHNGKKEIVK